MAGKMKINNNGLLYDLIFLLFLSNLAVSGCNIKKSEIKTVEPDNSRSGVRLVYELDVPTLHANRRNEIVNKIAASFGEKPVTFKKLHDDYFSIEFENNTDMQKAVQELMAEYEKIIKEVSRDTENMFIRFSLTPEEKERILTSASKEAAKTISNRMDAMGLEETSVTSKGASITIDIWNIDEKELERLKTILVKVARLEFKIVDDEGSKFFQKIQGEIPESSGIKLMKEETNGSLTDSFYLTASSTALKSGKLIIQEFLCDMSIPKGHVVHYGHHEETGKSAKLAEGETWKTWYLWSDAELTGKYVKSARAASDPYTLIPNVALTFNDEGSEILKKVTGENIMRRMAVVIDGYVYIAPMISEKISGGRASIQLGSGKDYQALLIEVFDLAVALKAGALPAPIKLVSTSTISK